MELPNRLLPRAKLLICIHIPYVHVNCSPKLQPKKSFTNRNEMCLMHADVDIVTSIITDVLSMYT